MALHVWLSCMRGFSSVITFVLNTCHRCVYGNKQHWGFQSEPLNSSGNVWKYFFSAALTMMVNYIVGEEGTKTVVGTETVISLVTTWFTCCLRLRLSQGLRGMYRLNRNSLGLKDAQPGVTPLLQLLWGSYVKQAVYNIKPACREVISYNEADWQPDGFLFLFVSEFGLQSNVEVPHFKKGFKATLTCCHSVLLWLYSKVPPPILFTWKTLWLLSNSECEPKAGYALATPPSARISIDKVTCCSLTYSLSLQTWEWSTALSAKSSIWCWHTRALWMDCQSTRGINRIPWGGEGSRLWLALAGNFLIQTDRSYWCTVVESVSAYWTAGAAHPMVILLCGDALNGKKWDWLLLGKID